MGAQHKPNRARLPRKDQLNLCHIQAEASDDAALPTGSHLPDEGSFRVPGVTSNGEVSASSVPISRSAGTTSRPSSVTQVRRSLGGIGPSSQNEKIPGRSTSRMWRSFLTSVLGD